MSASWIACILSVATLFDPSGRIRRDAVGFQPDFLATETPAGGVWPNGFAYFAGFVVGLKSGLHNPTAKDRCALSTRYDFPRYPGKPPAP